jgi:predicted DNA-binding transcriptional regulator AlpA
MITHAPEAPAEPAVMHTPWVFLGVSKWIFTTWERTGHAPKRLPLSGRPAWRRAEIEAFARKLRGESDSDVSTGK